MTTPPGQTRPQGWSRGEVFRPFKWEWIKIVEQKLWKVGPPFYLTSPIGETKWTKTSPPYIFSKALWLCQPWRSCQVKKGNHFLWSLFRTLLDRMALMSLDLRSWNLTKTFLSYTCPNCAKPSYWFHLKLL